MKKIGDFITNFFFEEDDSQEDYQQEPRRKEKKKNTTPVVVEEIPFVPIELNEKKPEKVPNTIGEKKLDEPKTSETKKQPNSIYQFTQVISPVYGIKDDENNYVPPVLHTTSSSKKSPLGTIISPVNGLLDEEENQHDVPDELANLQVTDLLENQKSEIEERSIEHGSAMPENLSFFDDEDN